MKNTQSRLERLADFLYEAGMLRRIQRSGYAFLGTGAENVAEHSYRAAVIGYVLARLAGADAARVTLLCLFHDLHEARTGDFNYVNHRYNECRAREALEDALEGTGLSHEVLGFFDEFESARNPEAELAHDADQLDLLCNLAAELSKGNAFASEWIENALKRLRTAPARELAEQILRADPNRWWYGQVDRDWWVRRGK
jgi:putative hydrolase of HD superfamily